MKKLILVLLTALQVQAGIVINPGSGGGGGGISTTLTSGHILVGNGSNVATDVAMSGDVTIGNTGVTAIGASKVTNTMLAGSIAPSKVTGTAAILGANSFTDSQTIASGKSFIILNGSGVTGNSVITSNSFGTLTIAGDSTAGASLFDSVAKTNNQLSVASTGIWIYNNSQNNVIYLGGGLKTNVTAVGNGNDTTEDNLITYTLGAGQLYTAQQRIKITAFGTFAPNATPKTVKLYFGATVLASSGSIAANGGGWRVEADLIMTGAATQVASSVLTLDGANIGLFGAQSFYTTPAETLSGSVVIKATGQTAVASANDIINKGLIVEQFQKAN